MYFIWRCPSKPIKVINSLMNVKVDRKFSSKNIYSGQVKVSPLYVGANPVKDSLKIIFNWQLSDEHEFPRSGPDYKSDDNQRE